MSAADFLLAPEVQKLLKPLLAAPLSRFSVNELTRRTRLEADVVERTLAHLVGSGMLARHSAQGDEAETVSADTGFVFYGELRSIALKSFAAAEPIRAMLRSKFKDSVLRAFVLGEDSDATVELLVVHGERVPDEAQMAAACQKLSATLGRHLKVHVISAGRHAARAARDGLDVPHGAIEIISGRDSKARPAAERTGLLQSTRKRLAALAR